MKSLLLTLLAAAFMGCGGGGGGPASGTPSAATLSLRIGGGPGDGLRSLRVQITKVEGEGAAGWVLFAEPTKTVDLVVLAAGGTEPLATSSGALPLGSYARIRVSFGNSTTAILGDGTPVAVTTPEATVVAAPPSFSGTQPGLVLLLDPGRSLQWRNGALVLRPSLQVLTDGQLGRLQGRLTAGGQGLAGVVVSAQAFQELGVPRILRRVVTGSDGSYALDLLPKGLPLHGVSQPLLGATSFDPQASPSITLAESPGEWSAAFTSRASISSFHGAFLPQGNSNQSGEVHLLGPIQAGSETKFFTLRTVPTFLDAGAESHRMGAIPTGSYVLRAYRSTWLGDGSVSTLGQNSTDLGLVLDFDTTVDFLW